jgi:soluble lytic murein transglycosylase-like protein
MRKKIDWFKYTTLLLFGVVVILLSWQFKNASLETRSLIFKEVFIERMQVKEFKNNMISPTAAEKTKFILDAVRHYKPLTFAVLSKIYDHSLRENVDPGLIAGIAYVESRLNPMADNGQDVGLMQINYETWKNKFKLNRENLKDLDYNLFFGIQILKSLLKNHGDQALQRYNGIGVGMNPNYPKMVRTWSVK